MVLESSRLSNRHGKHDPASNGTQAQAESEAFLDEKDPRSDSVKSSSTDRTDTDQSIDTAAERRARKLRFRVTLLIALLIVAVDLPSVLQGASVVRILEGIYCQQHYAEVDPEKIGKDGHVPEKLCKVEQVQSQLSSLRGWLTFWTHLPGLFLAIPFGMLADKYGRKWLFVVNIVSLQGRSIWQYIVCSFPHVFPLKTIWLEAILAIFGGGSMVATALIFVTLSDVTPTSSMASTFFRLGAANMLCFTIGPPIAAAIMKKDPWISFTLGLCLQAIAIPIALFLPETLGAIKPGTTDQKCTSSSSSPSFMDEKMQFAISNWAKFTRFLRQNAGFLTRDWRVLFLASTYPIRMTMGSLDSQLMQYVPQRYDWTMADTTNLQAVQSGVAMFMLLLVLPGLSSFLLNRRQYSSNRKDIFLTRMAFICYAIGLAGIGAAPVIAVFIIFLLITTLAAGCGAAVRALLTSWVQPDEVARLYTALGIIETIGSMAGGPVIAGLYNLGLGAALRTHSYFVLGLPWIVTGVIMMAVALATCLLNFNSRPPHDDGKAEFEPVPRQEPEDLELQDGTRQAHIPQDLATPVAPFTPTIPLTPMSATRSRALGHAW